MRVPTATAISPPEPVRALSAHLLRAAAGMVPLPRWLESHPLSAMSPSARQLAWAVGRHITRNPDHGFVMAERVPPSGIGSLWPLYQAAPSLAHIHHAYPRFAALLLEHLQIDILEGDQSVCLRHVTLPGFRVDRAEQDFRAALQVATWRGLLQSSSVRALFAHFTYPRPRSTASHERLLGTRELRFSQPQLLLSLDRRYWDAPLPTRDAAQFEQRLAEACRAARAAVEPALEQRVEAALGMRFSFVETIAARPRLAAAGACLLGLPALRVGLVLDDYFIASRLRSVDGSMRWNGLFDAFSLVPRDGLTTLRELGAMPWWSDSDLTLDFLRPLSAFTHGVDVALFADSPWLMHLESLLLLAALNWAVVGWYERLFASRQRAFGLAVALFVLAPGNVFAASWLANRNAILAALFSVISLSWHDRARSGERGYAFYSSVAVTLSLLSGEIGASVLPLLVAYTAYLDAAPWRARLRSLVPVLGITLCWLVLHRWLGHGARASSLYVDVLIDPLGYARSLSENLLLLSFGQWGLPVITLRLMLSSAGAVVLACVAGTCLLLWAPRVQRLLRTDARARFCALATALCLLPIASTAVHDRLLVVANVTGLALVSLAVEAMPTLRWLQVAMNVRLGLAAVLCLAYSGSLWEHVRLAEEPFQRVAHAPAVRAQTLVIVNAPCVYYPLMLRWLRLYKNQPLPQRVRTLASGLVPLEVERADAHTLIVRAAEGLFHPLGQYRARHAPLPEPLSPVFLAQRLNQFARAKWAYRKGDGVQLSDVSISVLAATPDGYPSEVAFQFRDSLESPRLQFLAWQGQGYVPFALPPPGYLVKLAAEFQR